MHVTVGLSPAVEAWLVSQVQTATATLTRIERKLGAATQEEQREMSRLDDRIAALQGQITAETGVVQSAVALIKGFNGQLAAAVETALAAGATEAELQSLIDLGTGMQANTDTLAAAVAANTQPAVSADQALAPA